MPHTLIVSCVRGRKGGGMYSETSIATACVVSNSDLLLRTFLGVGVEGEEGR